MVIVKEKEKVQVDSNVLVERRSLVATHHGFPVVSFIDTPGAFADLKSEELGQGEAIAHNLRTIFGLKVPIISIVVLVVPWQLDVPTNYLCLKRLFSMSPGDLILFHYFSPFFR